MSLKYMSRNICLYIVSIDNDISFSFNIQLIFNKKNICISWGGRSSPYFMSPFSWSMWTGCPIARNVPESISTVHVLRHVEEGGREPTWVSEWKKKNGVSTPDSFQAFFRRCTGQKKKCIVKRGQGWPLSLHHVGTVVYIKSRSIWRRSTSITNPSASQARRLFWSSDTRVWQRDYVYY